jgi:hypothetical protein
LKPVTPVTPVTTEGIVPLHDLIKKDLCKFDKLDRQRLQRRIQKLGSAAQISFAKQILLQDHNRLLAKVNSEAKVRRSMRSVVLKKAKVMSYEDLEEARAKRAAKEKASTAKGKARDSRMCGRVQRGGPSTGKSTRSTKRCPCACVIDTLEC